jgi:predicted DNA binding CopG/RHH family protein
MNTEEFDNYFDNGGDISHLIDRSKGVRLNDETQRVNIDFPATILREIDKEAARIGVPRQSLIKMWIAEKLKEVA